MNFVQSLLAHLNLDALQFRPQQRDEHEQLRGASSPARRGFVAIGAVFCLAMMATTAWGAAKTLTWQSTSSTAWETAGNWYDEGAAATSTTAPTSADAVTIDNSRGATVNPTISVNLQACKTLVVGNGFILTLTGTAASATILTVGDGLTGNNDVTIQNGGEIDNLAATTGGNPLALTDSTKDKFRIDNGGKYLHNTARSFSTPLPAAACDFDVSSTVEFGQASTTSATLSSRTYGNLTLSATATKAYTASGSSATINGTLTLSSANVSFSPGMSAAQVVTVNNLSVATGATFSPTSVNAWSITFVGNVINNGTITLPSANLSVAFNGSSTLSGNAVTFANGLAVNSAKTLTLSTGIAISAGKDGTINGVLNCGANSITGSGTVTVGATGTLTGKDPGAISPGLTLNGT